MSNILLKCHFCIIGVLKMEHDKLSSDMWIDQNLSQSKNEENVEAVLDFTPVTSNGSVSQNDEVAEVNVSDTIYEGTIFFSERKVGLYIFYD